MNDTELRNSELAQAGRGRKMKRALLALACVVGMVGAVLAQPVEVAKLTAFDGVLGNDYGVTSRIEGDYAFVSADGDNSYQGAVYVYKRNSGTGAWEFLKKLTASDGATGDYFGFGLHANGDMLAVGAHADDSYRGSVYLFQRDAGGTDNWGEVKKIIPGDATDGFGASVCLMGDTLAVGSPNDNSAASHAGAAYIFYRNHGGADNWGQVVKLVPSDGATDDRFGNRGIAIANGVCIVGSYGDDPGGSAYVFYRDTGGADAWGFVKKIEPTTPVTGDQFGLDIAIWNDEVAISGSVLRPWI